MRPGMGLIPSIKQLAPALPGTATDANAMILEHWKNWLDKNRPDSGIGFAQFSILDMPFRDNSIPVFTSYIGLSSTRGGQTDYDTAVNEVFRCLAPGGYLYTIESEWTDIPAILQVFEKWDGSHGISSQKNRQAGMTAFLQPDLKSSAKEYPIADILPPTITNWAKPPAGSEYRWE